MLGSSALRTQLNVRAAVRSSMTLSRADSLISFSTHTTFAAVRLTHLARLCRLISARIEFVSPIQMVAWWPLPNLSVWRREKMNTAGESTISAVRG